MRDINLRFTYLLT